MTTPAQRLHSILVEVDEEHGCGDLPDDVCLEVPGNATRIVAAQTLQSIGDRIVDAKTVLPWLLAAAGAPAALVGLLVPIRESGSLLPQAALVPWVRRRPVRKWVWVVGGAGQAAAVAAMAVAAATSTGTVTGIAVLVALAVFALARSLSSIASKDVLGRTVPKGQRGQVNGLATVASGAVAVSVGAAIRRYGGEDANLQALAVLLAAAALVWVGATVVFAAVHEPVVGEDSALDAGWLGHALALLRGDPPFRRFVLARTLLLVSALSPPFVVTLAADEASVGFGSLGPFLIASGLAGLIGGRVFGRLADRSSRQVMMAGAGASSLVIVVFLALLAVPAARAAVWLYPTTYLLLALAHTGVRVGRKTYVVDLAGGNRRTDYVAVSNTAMGVLLLVTGAVSGGLAQVGVEIALGFLALLGIVGVLVSRALPEVTRPG
jgi:hypothetical protein